MDIIEQFSKNIKHLREQNNMTINELSKLTGITKSYLLKVENMQVKTISFKQLNSFCKVFKAEVKDILY